MGKNTNSIDSLTTSIWAVLLLKNRNAFLSLLLRSSFFYFNSSDLISSALIFPYNFFAFINIYYDNNIDYSINSYTKANNYPKVELGSNNELP